MFHCVIFGFAAVAAPRGGGGGGGLGGLGGLGDPPVLARIYFVIRLNSRREC